MNPRGFGCLHPGWINEAYRKTLEQTIPAQHLNEIRELSKKEFFKGFLRACAELRAVRLSLD